MESNNQDKWYALLQGIHLVKNYLMHKLIITGDLNNVIYHLNLYINPYNLKSQFIYKRIKWKLKSLPWYKVFLAIMNCLAACGLIHNRKVEKKAINFMGVGAQGLIIVHLSLLTRIV